MATFKQQTPSRQGYFETLSNLSEQQLKNKNLRTDSTGVKSLTTGEQDAEKKATEVGENIEKINFQSPEIVLPKPPESVVDTQARNIKQVVDPILRYGSTMNNDQVLEQIKTITDPARTQIAKQADTANASITQAIEALQNKASADLKDHRKFIETQMNTTAAQGLTGQKSAIEQADLEIAEAMQDPSMRTSDVAQLAIVYKQLDPRLAVLQGEIMRGEVSDLRGAALSALQNYTAAKSMKDANVSGLGDIESAAQERLQQQEQDFENKLTSTSQEALKGLSEWRRGQEAILDKWEGDAKAISEAGNELAKKKDIQKGIETQRKNDVTMSKLNTKYNLGLPPEYSKNPSKFIQEMRAWLTRSPQIFADDTTGKVTTHRFFKAIEEMSNNPDLSKDVRDQARTEMDYWKGVQYTQQAGVNDSGDKAWVHKLKDAQGNIVAKWYSRR